MEWIAIGVLAAVVWGLGSRLSRLEERLRAIAPEKPAVSGRPAAPVRHAGPPRPQAARDSLPTAPPGAPAAPPTPIPSRHGTAPVEVPDAAARPSSTAAVASAAPSVLRQRWQAVERAVAENWTGILGAGILVAGISFLGVYTALRLDPLLRFGMIVAVAAGLGSLYLVLRRHERWLPLAAWLRSAGAAVFLFACTGAGALPGLGIRWIHAPGPALALLLVGLAVNLCIAALAGREPFASLHVVLSLIPLAIVPQGATALFVATGVTLFGVGLAHRERWDRHLLAILIAFAAHHLAWYMRVGGSGAVLLVRIEGVSCALCVAVAAALVHYRRDYASPRPARLPLLVHVGNWAFAGLWLLLYTAGTQIRGAALMGTGLFAFALARAARRRGLRWLHLTDTLVAQALLVAGVVALHPFAPHWLFVPAVVFLECALYLRVVLSEGEVLLTRTGIHLLHGSAALLGVGAVAVAARAESDVQIPLLLLAMLAAGLGIHLALVRRRGERLDSFSLYGARGGKEAGVSVLGCLLGLLAIGALAGLRRDPWLGVAALGSIGPLVAAGRRFSLRGATCGAWSALGIAHALVWARLLFGAPVAVSTQVAVLVPTALLALGAVRWTPSGAWQPQLRAIAIYLLGAHLAVASYTLLHPLSPLAPCVVWLCLSLAAVEGTRRLASDAAGALLQVGYGYLAAFGAAYVLVVLQAQSFLGPVRVRLLVELFALAVFAYWIVSRPPETVGAPWLWRRVHPLLLEAALALLASTVAVEVATQWRPLAWVLLALLLLAPPLSSIDSRMRFYSLILYWASVFDMAVVVSVFQTPSLRWTDQPETTAAFAIGAQMAYLIWASSRLALGAVRFPDGLGRLAAACRRIDGRRSLWLYIPFFAGVALFVYWRFDPSLLTLLWSAEAFAVFVLSVVLREGHLRTTALVGLGACLLRLVSYDMAQADLGLRGIVFVCVGVLMLAMNTVYNKYRARLE